MSAKDPGSAAATPALMTDSRGGDTADAVAAETQQAETTRSEPWWSQLAALMQGNEPVETPRMRLGYACVNTQLPSSARTVRLANATPERLRELIASNLDALEAIVRWNAAHGIVVFRLTSNLIPFGSHPVNTLHWWDEFAERFDRLAHLLRATGGRISTHPGQYTVLASADPAVAASARAELEYHDRLLGALGLDASHKLVLHVGAGSAEKREAGRRFAASFARLSEGLQRRLTIENDERWPLADVLELTQPLGLPVVFDAFHHRLAPSWPELDDRAAVLATAETWRAGDGRQEVHFSTQEPGKRPGAHAQSLDLAQFVEFAGPVVDLPLDCILEVKDKEQSVLRARELIDLAA